MQADKYTVVEIVDERTDESGPLQVTGVLINGQRVRVAAHGIKIDYDVPGPYTRPEKLVMVTVDLLVDEFHIHRAPGSFPDEPPITGATFDEAPPTREQFKSLLASIPSKYGGATVHTAVLDDFDRMVSEVEASAKRRGAEQALEDFKRFAIRSMPDPVTRESVIMNLEIALRRLRAEHYADKGRQA